MARGKTSKRALPAAVGQHPAIGHQEGRKVRGTSLALKLAVTITLMVMVFMGGFAVFLRGFILESMTEQVKTTALEAARAGALADIDAWGSHFGTDYQGLDSAQIQAIVDQFRPGEYERLYDSPELRATREWNRNRLRRFLAPDVRILAADIVTPDNKPIATSFEGAMSYGAFKGTESAPDSGGAWAEQGQLTTDSGSKVTHVIRGQAPIVDADGQTVAWFGVYIQARAIEQAADRFMLGVAYAAALFVLIGAGLSFMMGRRITRPLKQLQADMRIVAEGDLEHHTVPHSSDEIGDLARTFNAMTKSLHEAQLQERAAARSLHQVAVAGEVTDRLFPQQLPMLPDYDMAGHHAVAGSLGGEYYDVMEMEGGHFGFLMASASGGGVAAAMVMAMARSYVEVVSRIERDPGEVLKKVNELMAGDLREGMYVSVLLAVLEPATGMLRVANAGHAPLLICKGGKKLASLHSEGIALGFDEGPVFDRTLKVAQVHLDPGDRAVLHCAGITALARADGSELGEKRFKTLVLKASALPAGRFVKVLADALDQFRGKHPLSVDVTLLTLGRHAD